MPIDLFKFFFTHGVAEGFYENSFRTAEVGYREWTLNSGSDNLGLSGCLLAVMVGLVMAYT